WPDLRQRKKLSQPGFDHKYASIDSQDMAFTKKLFARLRGTRHIHALIKTKSEFPKGFPQRNIGSTRVFERLDSQDKTVTLTFDRRSFECLHCPVKYDTRSLDLLQ